MSVTKATVLLFLLPGLAGLTGGESLQSLGAGLACLFSEVLIVNSIKK